MDEEHFKLACAFTIKLAEIAHQCGTQSRRLEAYLSDVINSFGYEGLFRVNPNEINLDFYKNDLDQISKTIYMKEAGINLQKLAKLDDLISDLRSKKINLEQANVLLNEISNTCTKVYSRFVTALGYALAGLGFAGFLKCSYSDLGLSALLSVLVYFICSSKTGFWKSGYALPFFCSFSIGFIAALIGIFIPNINVHLIALSALIYLIPGFTISCGIIELSYRYVISGLINLINGMIYLSVLFFGTYFGMEIIKKFFTLTDNHYSHINNYLSWPLAIVMAAGFCIIFQVPKRFFGWAMAGIVFVCVGIIVGIQVDSVNLGNLFGSIVAIVYANIWSDKYEHSASIVLIPSVVFLVSGSIGFRGFLALSSNNISVGLHDVSQMFLVAIMIAIGLGIGNCLYRTKISL